MNKDEFARELFLTLRKEIEEAKARIFKIVTYGIVTVPAAQILAQIQNLSIITLAIPFLVIVIALLFLSENHTVMRCGTYIKDFIEPEVSDFIGWEKWLNDKHESSKRTVDKYLGYCIYLLFFVYYLGSVYLSFNYTMTIFNTIGCAISISIYVAVGIWFLLFLITNIQVTTSTESELWLDFIKNQQNHP